MGLWVPGIHMFTKWVCWVEQSLRVEHERAGFSLPFHSRTFVGAVGRGPHTRKQPEVLWKVSTQAVGRKEHCPQQSSRFL